MQVDDAWLPALWDRIGVKMGLAAYKRYCMLRVEALNHALATCRAEQVRYHLCWGSWHGPHAHDIPLADMVDVMLAVKAQTYLIEAANARHEHEYSCGNTSSCPRARSSRPGVVTHSTPLIEHPELVSQRIQRFASIVGRENVIASTDCGLGLRCHPQIAWAKLKACRRRRARDSRAALLSSEAAAPPTASATALAIFALELILSWQRCRRSRDPQLFLARAVHDAGLDANPIGVRRKASLDEDVGVEGLADVARPAALGVLGARGGARDDAEAPVAHELGRDAFREALASAALPPSLA